MWRGEVFAISDCLVPHAVNGSQGLKSVLLHYTFQHRVFAECGLLWASKSGLSTTASLHIPSPGHGVNSIPELELLGNSGIGIGIACLNKV